MANKYTPILVNKRRFSYTIGTDEIQAKLTVFKGNELSYLLDIPVEFWLNYTGSWSKHEDYTTNVYGIAHLKHSTASFPTIDCCLGYAKVTIDGTVYISNTIRFNFK